MAKDKGVYVSASSLTDYIVCSYRAYWRIFEPSEGVPSREMLMGTITHKVLEKAWQNIDVALNLAESLCKKEGIDEIGKNSVYHFIHTFFERFNILVDKNDSVEKRFKVNLYDDVYLVGVFDRVSRGTVIDWKTNANPPKKIDNNVQFIIYDLAYNLLYGKKAEGLYLAALKDGSLVRYTESKQHAETLVQSVIPQFVQDVRNKSFVKSGLFTGACYRCPYKIQCLGTESRNVVDYQPPLEE